MKYECYSTTDRGLEDLVVIDLKKEHNINAEYKGYLGKIFYKADLEDILRLNLSAKSINRVIIKIGESDVRSLEEIEREIKRIDFTDYIGPGQSFAIRANRIGKHRFTSIDIARMSGKAVIDSFLDSTGRKLKVNLNKPDVEIIVEVIDNKLLVGVDTSGLSLHIRRYRKFNHPLPLKTTIAYLLTRAIEWEGGKNLLDPTCGSGTILIEAALWMRKIPTCKFRNFEEFAFSKLKFVDMDNAINLCEKLIEDIKWGEKAPIFGVDINQKFLNGAILNAENAAVLDTIKFVQGDATKIRSYLGDREFDFIASNPPYMLADREKLIKFYEGYIKSLYEVAATGAKIAVLSTEKKLIERNIQKTELNLLHIRGIPYGSLRVQLMIFKKE
ncbi:MAG: tRNA (guanine(6)-N2)-methyltransferase [Candidatus Njordarchaeia archaeon]